MDGGYIFIMANTMKEIISRNLEAKPKLIRAFSTFFVVIASSSSRWHQHYTWWPAWWRWWCPSPTSPGCTRACTPPTPGWPRPWWRGCSSARRWVQTPRWCLMLTTKFGDTREMRLERVMLTNFYFWFIYIGSLSWRQWSQFWGDRRWGRADSEVWRVEPGHEVQHGDHLDWVDRRGGDEDVHLEDQPQQHQNQEHGGG